MTFTPPKPEPWSPPEPTRGQLDLPRYDAAIATRKAFGEALRALGAARSDVVALDGEVANSTYTEDLQSVAPDRFFELYIAEQAMLGTAVGMQVLGKVPFAATFGAFLSRAYDFIRMAAISRANIRLSGSHAGVSIGEDGPSQMALEDIAMMRAVHGSTVLQPCDANQTARLVAEMADTDGIVFLRTLRSSDEDAVTIVASGITVPEATKAADELQKSDVAVRIIDAYSIKPIDSDALREASQATGGKVIAVEDHWPEGGLGEAVLSALSEESDILHFEHLAVENMPGSGKSEELLDAAGIDASHIAAAVHKLLNA